MIPVRPEPFQQCAEDDRTSIIGSKGEEDFDRDGSEVEAHYHGQVLEQSNDRCSYAPRIQRVERYSVIVVDFVKTHSTDNLNPSSRKSGKKTRKMIPGQH